MFLLGLLREILNSHNLLARQTSYPFFDPACRSYEAIRAASIDRRPLTAICETFGITEYQYRQALDAFRKGGVAYLIGLSFPKLIESLDIEAERMIYVLKNARPWIPATKMVLILQGFGHKIELSRMRHLYASYGWAQGTKEYDDIDFGALNLKVVTLSRLQSKVLPSSGFFREEDRLQKLLEVFRTIGTRGITLRYPGSRVSLQKQKRAFRMLGLIGLVDQARPAFRNSKLGFKEEGKLILSKIQHPDKSEIDYQRFYGQNKSMSTPPALGKFLTVGMCRPFNQNLRETWNVWVHSNILDRSRMICYRYGDCPKITDYRFGPVDC